MSGKIMYWLQEVMVWAVAILLAGFVGAGVGVLVTSPVEQTREAACFDSGDKEICKEVK